MISILKKKLHKNNSGFTLTEMIVSFALLAIFLVAASAFIGTITNLFYNIKGETYSRQVSDILLQKLESEIDGSKYEKNSDNNLKILAGFDSDIEADVGNVIDLYDKTDTHIKIYSEKAGEPDSQKDEIKIYYYPIGSLGETTWRFDKSVYNGFEVKELNFVRGSHLADFTAASDYGVNPSGTYDDDVIIIFLKLDSSRYGEYYFYRFVRMYNYED